MSKQTRVNRKGREVLQRAARKGSANGAAKSSRGKEGGVPRVDWTGLTVGFILGVLCWQVSETLGITRLVPAFRVPYWLPAAGLAGALAGASRARGLLWAVSGSLAALLLVVGYTPFVVPAVRGLVRSDPLRPVEAAVVLSSDISPSGSLTPQAQFRLLRGYEVVQQGYARRLVLTRLAPPRPSYVPTVRTQLRNLDIDIPLVETEIVGDTNDEARAVKRLADASGWDTVILVTSPTHTRRAAAVFEKAGVNVLATPCPAANYDLAALHSPRERFHAFADWLYETVGTQWYRLKGRI